MSTSPTPSTISGTTQSRGARSAVAAVACSAMLGVLAIAGPASAQSTPAPAEDTAARAELACSRIPNITIHTTNVLARINGDAERRGSLLWLETKIDQARERNREDLAVVLENRLEVRRSLIPVLEDRLVRLDELSIRCAEAGFDQ